MVLIHAHFLIAIQLICVHIFTAMNCPGNMIYTERTSPCVATCADPQKDRCPMEPESEGCVCPEGLVLDGNTCIPKDECGCLLPNGIYLKVRISIETTRHKVYKIKKHLDRYIFKHWSELCDVHKWWAWFISKAIVKDDKHGSFTETCYTTPTSDLKMQPG